MDIRHLCAKLKERVAVDLQQAIDPGAKDQILIAALYQMSRSVLPELGSPKKSPEYLQGQGAVLELISFLAIQLIRGALPERRGVAVLCEIREGCLDPQLKRKLSVYAQELLAKSIPQQPACGKKRWRVCLTGLSALAVLALFFASLNRQASEPQLPPQPAEPAAAAASATSRPAVAGVSFPPAQAAEGARRQLPVAAESRAAESSHTRSRPESFPEGHTTKVRIVNNQVLVPVTIENGGASVRLELVLDTGSTRTALHDSLSGRLLIDLHEAKSSRAEVADGRLILSRIASVDSLLVGPYAMTSMELEFIPYQGREGTHDGLLGMDFLGRHRYQIDMERELIRWL